MPDTSPTIASEVPEATVNRLCFKLDRAEIKLKRDMQTVKALLPPEDADDIHISPEVSVTNTSVDEAVTLANGGTYHLSLRGRRPLPHGALDPFYVDNELGSIL